MKKCLLTAAAVFFAAFANAQVGEKMVGKWKTVDEKSGEANSVILIYKSSDGLYNGKVVELFQDKDAVCAKCTDENKGKPVVGMRFLKDMKDEGDALRGALVNPENGKIYYCALSPEADGKLKFRGSIDKRGVFGRTQYWVRVR